MKKGFVLFLSLICSVYLTSCSPDIDDDLVYAPSDFYYPGTLSIPFYTNGSTGFPNINWGNEAGIFTLNQTYQGVSINAQNGVISWNEDLPLGENLLTITATNSAGTAETMVLFLHKFSGIFNGGYNSDPNSTVVPSANLMLNCNENETLTVTDSGETATGAWGFNLQGDLICTYELAGVNYQLYYDLTYSVDINPVLVGYKKVVGSTVNSGYSRMEYE
jgi:hypothetical protein